MCESACSKERSCRVTTEGPANPRGRACWKCASCGRSRRSSSGSQHGHPRLLQPRPQRHRLDPVGDELGVAADGAEMEVGGDAGQLPQQVGDVGLVAGALASEHVGVDQDHTSSSYTARVAAATSPQEVPAAAGPGANAAAIPARIESTSSGST